MSESSHMPPLVLAEEEPNTGPTGTKQFAPKQASGKSRAGQGDTARQPDSSPCVPLFQRDIVWDAQISIAWVQCHTS